MVEGRTHRPVIEAGRCQICNVCIRGCPAELIPEYRKEKKSLRGSIYQKDFRGRHEEPKVPLPPCQQACPIDQDTRGYTTLIAKGKFEEALELIREVNPLPAVCGYICHHPCEEVCLRKGVDQPVSLRLLKRFVAEDARRPGAPSRGTRKPRRSRREKVLVVGSGPAGLAAAKDLRLLGYGVTILEALPVLGGMLAVGIPAFRLPREVLQTEIEGIKQLGVEMRTGERFRIDGDPKVFRKLGFQAVFLGLGAQRSARLGIEGENLRGVVHGLEFLRNINLGKKVEIGNRVVVIGGGNVALDVARSALRLGAKTVSIYYRRTRAEMPAIPEEVEEAIREGIRIHFLYAPTKIIGRKGTAAGIEFLRMRLGSPDASGRPTPIPIKGSNVKVAADTVIPAVGQKVEPWLGRAFETYPDGRVRVDRETGATNVRGIFAGGDMVTGPGWAIDAIAAGKRAAQAIDRFLS